MNTPETLNYTEIPNIIFDYWMRHLSDESFMILTCIFRNIEISETEILKKCNIPHEFIKDYLKELLENDLIFIAPHSQEPLYQIRHFDEVE